MNRRGISTIVATVILVLVSVSFVSILWLGLYPQISKRIVNPDPSLTVEIKRDGYTSFNPESRIVSAQYSVLGSVDPKYLQVTLELEDGSTVEKIVDSLPAGHVRVDYFDVSGIAAGKDVRGVSVVPIYDIEGSEIYGWYKDSQELIEETKGIDDYNWDEIEEIEDDNLVSSRVTFFGSTPPNKYNPQLGNSVTVEAQSADVDNVGLFIDWDNSLVLWLGMEEESGMIKDRSNYGNDARVHGADFTSSGKYGGAYSFGIDKYIEVADDDSFDLTDGITLSAWVYIENPVGYSKIIIKPTPTYAEPWELYVIDMGPSGLNPRMLLSDGVEDSVYKSLYSYDGGGTGADNPNFNINTWHHIVATFDGSEMIIYLDGVEQNRGDTVGPTAMPDASPVNPPGTPTYFDLPEVVTNNENLIIGNYLEENPGSGRNLYVDRIDEVMIFNRPLSQNEVQNLYNAGNGDSISVTFSGLENRLYNFKAHVLGIGDGEAYSTEARKAIIGVSP